MAATNPANRILALNVLAFTICFAAWTMYGVLATYLVDTRILTLDRAQLGWLIGTPILTGSILRLPLGLLTDRFGGKPMYIVTMMVSAVGLYLTSMVSDFQGLVLTGLLFGVGGATFAIGVAYTSIWFPKERQGTALGLLGLGNLGTAVTSLGAPALLNVFTNGGANPDGWRALPKVYALSLVVMSVLMFLLAQNKTPDRTAMKSFGLMISPLKEVRVWRFGLYYFFLFGGFVALSQWLITYYVSVYGMALATAGFFATCFSLPSAGTRAIGGFLADKFGARSTLYVVLSGVALLFVLLSIPRMDITSPGETVLADRAGRVTEIGDGFIKVDEQTYPFKAQPLAEPKTAEREKALILPVFSSWQEPAVQVGDEVKKKQILAMGKTQIYFQANQAVFTVLLMAAGVLMGLGMAAVFKHIPDYYPGSVGVVGGIVGVLGGLGGFFLPILFGSLLKWSGIWTTCWLLLSALAILCGLWMHLVVLRQTHQIERAEGRARG
jgi:NNP family nitrate/nitrite transporter-like MFS transporter